MTHTVLSSDETLAETEASQGQIANASDETAMEMPVPEQDGPDSLTDDGTAEDESSASEDQAVETMIHADDAHTHGSTDDQSTAMDQTFEQIPHASAIEMPEDTSGHMSHGDSHASGADHMTAQKLVGSGTTTLADVVADHNHDTTMAGHTAHGHDASLAAGHTALLDLFPDPSDGGTSVAINGGSWFDPNTWADGKVPADGQSVYIPEGIVVIYDGVSDVRLDTVGVKGELHFAVDTDSKMVVDTLITAPSSVFTIGSEERPVAADVTVDIVIADNGAIDLITDPTQLGRGVVTHGHVEVHGASKAPYLKLADEPRAGDTELKLEGDVGSWQVGDSLVVMGTKFVGNDANGILRTQDEEVTIVAIDEATGTVTIDRALQYDHTTPPYASRPGLDNELSVYVGNSTRNVTFSSENPEGVRGHVMFMHNPDVEVRFAEFDELGRTDKSKPINTDELWDENDWSNRGPDIKNGPGADVIGTARNPGTDNVEGRYALHIHRTGAEKDAKLAILEGNSVTGSPGWGIVHHDSHAAIDYNFVYGVAGAGIVSEDGNETGQWIGNFVTSTVGTGRDPDKSGDANVLTLEKTGDFGIEGVAFESQARQILQQDNIAANSKTAWMFNTSETSTVGPTVDVIQFDPSGNPFIRKVRFDEEDTSIIGFSGNQIIATTEGIFTGHRNIDNATDIQQTFSDLTIYNVQKEAIHIFNYTNEYVIKDALIVNSGRGLKVGDKVEGINLSNVHFDDVYEALNARGYNATATYVDVTFNDVDRTILAFDYDGVHKNFDHTIIDSSTITPVDQITFVMDGNARTQLGPGGGELDIRGTFTDSVGTFRFHANEWIRQSVHTFDGLQTGLNGRDVQYALEKYGAIKNADGSWDLAFYWWVGDRMTGENQAVFIPISLVGFQESDLEAHRIPEFTPPSNVVSLYYSGGIQSIDQDFSAAASSAPPTPSDPTPTDPTPTDPTPVDPTPTDPTPTDPTPVDPTPTDPTPTDPTPVDPTPTDPTPTDPTPTDPTPTDPTPTDPTPVDPTPTDPTPTDPTPTDPTPTDPTPTDPTPVDPTPTDPTPTDPTPTQPATGTLTEMILAAVEGRGTTWDPLLVDGSIGKTSGAATISLNFNADVVSGIRGLLSKDTDGRVGDGDSHMSAFIRKGSLVVQFEHEGQQVRLTKSGLQANRDYKLEIIMDGQTVSARLDGVQFGPTADLALTTADLPDDWLVAATAGEAVSGENEFKRVFDGDITNIEITYDTDPQPAAQLPTAPAPSDPVPTPPISTPTDPEPEPTPTPVSILPTIPYPEPDPTPTTPTGSDPTQPVADPAPAPAPATGPLSSLILAAVEGRGTTGDPILVGGDVGQTTGGATLSLTFNADTVDGIRGLISKDTDGQRGDGDSHVSAFIKRGTLTVQFEHEGKLLAFSKSGIQENRDYKLEIVMDGDGVSALLDGTEFGAQSNFGLTTADLPDDWLIAATAGVAKSGEGEFKRVFDGTIKDVEITVHDVADLSPAQNAAVFRQDKPMELDRSEASALNMGHHEAFEIESGRISLDFEADRVDQLGGLFSKDAGSAPADSDQISAYIEGGRLSVAFDNGQDTIVFNSTALSRDKTYGLDVEFGSDGVAVLLDGQVIGSDANFAFDLSDNTENFQFGALGDQSASGAGDIRAVFDGTISNIAVITDLG